MCGVENVKLFSFVLNSGKCLARNSDLSQLKKENGCPATSAGTVAVGDRSLYWYCSASEGGPSSNFSENPTHVDGVIDPKKIFCPNL